MQDQFDGTSHKAQAQYISRTPGMDAKEQAMLRGLAQGWQGIGPPKRKRILQKLKNGRKVYRAGGSNSVGTANDDSLVNEPLNADYDGMLDVGDEANDVSPTEGPLSGPPPVKGVDSDRFSAQRAPQPALRRAAATAPPGPGPLHLDAQQRLVRDALEQDIDARMSQISGTDRRMLQGLLGDIHKNFMP